MTTSNPRHLRIDGMTGDITVQRVKAALNSVQGVVCNSVQVGAASITCDEPGNCSNAIAALYSAGFKARETLGSSARNGAGTAAPKEANAAQPSQASETTLNEGACSAIAYGAGEDACSAIPQVNIPEKSAEPVLPATA